MGQFAQPSTSQACSLGDIENAATHVEGTLYFQILAFNLVTLILCQLFEKVVFDEYHRRV